MPIIKAVLEKFVPTADDAIEVVKGRVCLLDGTPIYISEPLPGKAHDKTAFDETPVAEIIRNSRRRDRR